MKLVCVGASYKFVRRVVQDLIKTGQFEGSEIAVVDIIKEPLDIVVDACKAIVEDRKSTIKVWGTLDRKEALEGADFVFAAIKVGGFDAARKEIDACIKYGIHHVIGDTIGPAALSRSLREIPVMIDIARDIEKYCPDAWLINVSNPMTAMVKAVADYTNVKVLGLCHGTTEIRDEIARAYGVDPSEVTYKGLGVNHLVFAKDICVKGRDVTATLYDDVAKVKDVDTGQWKLCREMLKLTGYLPLIEDRHLVEFIPYYVLNGTNDGRSYVAGPIDFSEKIAQRQQLENIHKEFSSGIRKLGADYGYSGENVHEIMMSLYYGKEGIHVVNIPNRSYCKDLKAGSVIEIPAVVRKDSVEGITIEEGAFDPHIISILYNLNVLYDYTVEAAMTGDRELVKRALMLDPNVRHLNTIDIIPNLVDDLIEVNREYLPDYWFKG